MTVQERIEQWAGECWNPKPLYQILQDSAREVINDMDPDTLQPLWSELTDSGSGVNVAAYRVLEARYLLRRANNISPSWRSNTNITLDQPSFYTMGDIAYVLPSGGTLLAVSHPTVLLSSTAVTNVPDALLNLIVLKSSEHMITHKMTRIRDTVNEDITLPTAPTALAAPTIGYTDAAKTDPSTTTVGTLPSDPTYLAPTIAGTSSPITISALPAAPVYIAPSLAAKPTAPTVGTLNLQLDVTGATNAAPTAPSAPNITYVGAQAAVTAASALAALGTAPAYIAPSLAAKPTAPTVGTLNLQLDVTGATNAAPVAPSAPVITYVGAQAAVTAASALAALGAAPAYTPPVFTGNISDITSAIPTEIDLALQINGSTALTVPSAPAAPALFSVGQSDVSINFTVPDLVPPQFVKSGSNLSFTSWDAEVTDEDPELMGAHLNKLSLELQETKQSIEQNQIEYARTIEVYRAKVNQAMKNAEISASQARDRQNQSDVMALQGYVQKLAHHGQEITVYQGQLEQKIAEAKFNLDRAIQGVATAQKLFLERYQADIQNAQMVFNAAQVEYQTDAQHKIETVRTLLQEALANMRASTDVNVQNQVRAMEALVSNYNMDLQLFERKVQLYQMEVDVTLREWLEQFNNEIRVFDSEAGVDVARYQAEIASASKAFEASLSAYQADAQHKIEAVRTLLQEALADMRASTDVNVQNQVRTMESLVSDYNLELQLFERKVQLYQVEVDVTLREWLEQFNNEIRVFDSEAGVDVARFQAEIGSASKAFDSSLAAYTAGTNRNSLQAQVNQGLAGIDVGRYQAEVANAAKAFEVSMGVYTAGVARNNLQAQIAQQEQQQIAAQTTDVSKQNKARELEAKIADYQASLSRKGQEIQIYSENVKSLVSQQASEESTRSEKLKMFALDRNNVRQHLIQATVAYEHRYRVHYPINVRMTDF